MAAQAQTMIPHLTAEQARGIPTFSRDESRPPLPLPTLKDTMARLQSFAAPFLQREGEKEELAALVSEALDDKSSLHRAHEIVKEKARASGNFVHAWWERYAYFASRDGG